MPTHCSRETTLSVSLRHTNTHSPAGGLISLLRKESPSSVKWGWWDVWHCIPKTIYLLVLTFQFLSMENITGVTKG